MSLVRSVWIHRPSTSINDEKEERAHEHGKIGARRPLMYAREDARHVMPASHRKHDAGKPEEEIQQHAKHGGHGGERDYPRHSGYFWAESWPLFREFRPRPMAPSQNLSKDQGALYWRER